LTIGRFDDLSIGGVTVCSFDESTIRRVVTTPNRGPCDEQVPINQQINKSTNQQINRSAA
jgi:hypothetical protein